MADQAANRSSTAVIVGLLSGHEIRVATHLIDSTSTATGDLPISIHIFSLLEETCAQAGQPRAGRCSRQ